MRSVLEIRNQYGFSQSQMAGYLGISKSLLSMVELGKRSLPMNAFKKLATLGLSYEQNAMEAPVSPTITVTQQAAMRKQLKKVLRETINKARRVEQKLDRLKDKRTNQQLQAAGIRKLLRINKQQAPGEDKLLNLRLYESNNRLASFCPLERSLMLIKLRSLHVEIDMLEELLKMPASKGLVIFG